MKLPIVHHLAPEDRALLERLVLALEDLAAAEIPSRGEMLARRRQPETAGASSPPCSMCGKTSAEHVGVRMDHFFVHSSSRVSVASESALVEAQLRERAREAGIELPEDD